MLVSYCSRSVFIIISLIIAAQSAFGGTTRLASTGQTSCFSDSGGNASCRGTGQDGEDRAGQVWPTPRFSVDSVTVTDNLTGLVWTKIAREAGAEYSCFPVSSTTAMTWEQAFALVECLNSRYYGGFNDWRLPNVIEMESLINLEDPQGVEWLDQQGFQNAWGSFWTSTTSPVNAEFAYRVNYFHPGSVAVGNKSEQNAVWPVRGSTSGPAALMKTGQTQSYHARDDGEIRAGVEWPQPRFEVEEEDCIFDVLTGLMWTRSADVSGQAVSFDAAISAAKKASKCGHKDWRLPNHRELLSMINFGEKSSITWLKKAGFKGLSTKKKNWSSSAYVYQSNSVWLLRLNESPSLWAEVKEKRHGYKNQVWLVRSVPPIPPSVTAVVPRQGPNDFPVGIYINGKGFSQGAIAYLGSVALSTSYSSTKQLAANVPMALAPGLYPVTVTNADGGSATLNDAYTVEPPTTDDVYANQDEFATSRQIEILGQATTINLLVRRFGGTNPLTDVNVNFYEGASSAGKFIGTASIPVLNPFSSAAVSITWTPETPGLVLLTAAIDVSPTETNPTTNMVVSGAQVVKLEPTPTPLPATPTPTPVAATPMPTEPPISSLVPDQTAPVIDSFAIDGGALNNVSGSLNLSFSATDPDVPAGTASGVAWAYYAVYEYFPWAGDWFITEESGWLPAQQGVTNVLYYSAGYFSGPRFVSLWVADRAQNTSQRVDRVTNYIKPDDFVIERESKFYLYPLLAGETIWASAYYRWGDADLYLWPPDWQTRGAWSSLYTNPDTLGAVAPVSGFYWLEVYGYQSAAYDLNVQLGLSSRYLPATFQSEATLDTRTPRTAPTRLLSTPNVVLRLADNTAASQVTLAAPKNSAKVRGAAVTLKWQPLYLAKNYTVQLSTNGKRWKNAGKTKKTKLSVKKLKANKNYFWRVKGITPLSPEGIWSESRSFRLN